MYENNYPNTTPELRDSNNTAQEQRQDQNLYGGQNAGNHYQNTYQNGVYRQSATENPYGNRSGYYQRSDSANTSGSTAGNTDSANSAGSYRYGNTYPNGYAQARTEADKKKAVKKPHGKGGYLKRALVSISLGLFFGAFAGLGWYGVHSVAGMFGEEQESGKPVQIEETVSDEVVSEADEAVTQPDAVDAEDNKLQAAENTSGKVMDVSEVVKEVMPAIVSIDNHYTEKISFFGQSVVNEAEASGSGIIVGQNDTELLIATNYHVIENAEKLTIKFAGDGEAEASVKGANASMDLAVIAVPISEIDKDTMNQITVATLGDSDLLEVGEPAIAIGNSLGYGQSVTTGVISALNRTIELSDGPSSSGTFIQTDAAINPGNSGGALLNMKGEVIGINSNKIGGSAVEGMGYAIPISAASPIIADLMLRETKNKVAEEERGYLGISGISVTEYVSEAYGMPKGVYISQVYDNTAAAAAGLRKGDIITTFDGVEIYSMDDLQRELEFHAKGDTVEVTIMSADVSGYSESKVQLTLGNKVTE